MDNFDSISARPSAISDLQGFLILTPRAFVKPPKHSPYHGSLDNPRFLSPENRRSKTPKPVTSSKRHQDQPKSISRFVVHDDKFESPILSRDSLCLEPEIKMKKKAKEKPVPREKAKKQSRSFKKAIKESLSFEKTKKESLTFEKTKKEFSPFASPKNEMKYTNTKVLVSPRAQQKLAAFNYIFDFDSDTDLGPQSPFRPIKSQEKELVTFIKPIKTKQICFQKSSENDKQIFNYSRQILLLNPKENEELLEEQKIKRVYICHYCRDIFSSGCALGGHISKVHYQNSNGKYSKKILKFREKKPLKKTNTFLRGLKKT